MSRLPARGESGAPQVRSGTSSLRLANEAAAEPRPQRPLTYAGSGLPLDPGFPLRDECWRRLGSAVRRRMAELSGPAIEWYATESSSPDRRIRGMTFGETGLSFAEPRYKDDGSPTHAVSCYLLNPASLRRVDVQGQPGVGSRSSARSGSTHTAIEGTPGRRYGPEPSPSGLSRGDLGALGNLPARAQELLQAPFLEHDDEVLRFDYYYEGHEYELNVFIMLLAGRRFVTAATGSQRVPAGRPPHLAQWTLTCRRAEVVRRIGS